MTTLITAAKETRDQQQKMGWDQGSQRRDLGSQAVGSGDQHYSKGITDPVFRHNNKDHKILKCALIGSPLHSRFSCSHATLLPTKVVSGEERCVTTLKTAV